MRAELVDESDPALTVAKPDELFAEELNAGRRAIRLGQFARQQRRDPVAPHYLAHRRLWPDTGYQFVVFG
jgi:hypothetical protein